MPHEPVKLVEVYAFGSRVGAVAPDPNTGAFAFEYDPDWVERGSELAPLKMPASADEIYVFPDLDERTFLGLPPLLADSLPDRFGNALIDAWMVRHGVDPDDVTPLDRLAYMADRGVGALEFRPPVRDGQDPATTAIQLADLVTAARAQVRGKIDEADEPTMAALTDLIRVGTSAGGARAKAVLAYNPDTGQIRSGQLGAPEGFSHWICKLDGVDAGDQELQDSSGYGRIEYAYHLMAREAGLDMMESRLLIEHDRAHFMTRRFDRPGGGVKRHVLTLCGMAHLDFNQPRAHDYAQYLDVIDRLQLGPDALEQAFTRIVFNVASVNCDDHTKNLAFLMDDTGHWQLAPAYDIAFSYRPSSRWVSAHQMSVLGKFEQINVGDLLTLGDKFAVPSPKDVVDRVLDAVSRWLDFAEVAEVPGETAEEIAQHHDVRGLLPS